MKLKSCASLFTHIKCAYQAKTNSHPQIMYICIHTHTHVCVHSHICIHKNKSTIVQYISLGICMIISIIFLDQQLLPVDFPSISFP